jgi:hypothetical protein
MEPLVQKAGFYTWKNKCVLLFLDDLKRFINRVMEDQILSADDGHLSFCTMQCSELVLILQVGDMFL